MAYSDTAPENISRLSVDPDEMERFGKIAEQWWDPEGMFKPLHQMNGFRLSYIRDQITDRFDLDDNADRPFEGLKILDIGCGGGLLSEPVARLGADMTSVDALEKNIKTAMTHAKDSGLDIDYRHGTAEQLAATGEQFDVVLNMEVVEHVTDPEAFIKTCASLVKPGGLMLVSTINKTMKAFLFAIVGAEYVLRWLPRGTHQYDKLVKPQDLSRYMSAGGLDPHAAEGMSMNPLNQSWRLSDDTSINYVMRGDKAV